MLSALVGPTLAASDIPFPSDVPGGVDHPMLKRFTGSALVGYKISDWDATMLPLAFGKGANGRPALTEKLDLEGKVTKLVYFAPLGKSSLEVYRNHEQALTAAGFKKRFSCEDKATCKEIHRLWAVDDRFEGMKWFKGRVPVSNTALVSFNSSLVDALSSATQTWVGTLSKGGQDTHVLLHTSQDYTAPATYIEFVEPKAMPTGQVTVDTKAMQAGLEAEGKVALYGLYFDTGKAEVKPESKAQLDEMAKLLQAQPTLKVYIVGHTDNQGNLDANLQLSQQRAQAVVGTLVGNHKINATRLHARGVASLSPVAGNGNEAGRARNRRVELVLQ